MFYVLNFENHKFSSCDNEAVADSLIHTLLSEGCSKDSLEIVNGFCDGVRLNIDEFRDLCKELGVPVPAPSVEVQPEKPNSRIAGIQAFKKNGETLQRAAEEERQRKFNDLISQIRSLKPRIDEVLATGKACVENGIGIDAYGRNLYRDLDSYEKGTFVTNGISHHLGFVVSRGSINFTLLGIDNGGACGAYDFRTDGEKVYSVHERNLNDIQEPRIMDMERFLREFDNFESSFYAYVDKTIEKQQKSVDQLIAKAQSKTQFVDNPGLHKTSHER